MFYDKILILKSMYIIRGTKMLKTIKIDFKDSHINNLNVIINDFDYLEEEYDDFDVGICKSNVGIGDKQIRDMERRKIQLQRQGRI